MNCKKETFEFNFNGKKSKCEMSIMEKKHGGHNIFITVNCDNFIAFRDKDIFEDFFTSLTEGLVEGFETSKEIRQELIPNDAEITTSEGMFIDAYYPNLYDEDEYLTDDGEIGKCLVNFSYENKKDEISFSMSALYWHNDVVYKDEYEECGTMPSCIKKEFKEMFLDNIVAF